LRLTLRISRGSISCLRANSSHKAYDSFILEKTIEEDPMPILEKLPCLVVLLLSGYSGSMVCSAQEFPRLQELELVYFECDEWRIEIGAMPSLSRLDLSLANMTKLPERLLYLPSLKELSLANMPQISEDDVTWENLHGKGCKVSHNLFSLPFRP